MWLLLISKMVTDYVGFIPCNRIICSSSRDFLGNNLQIVLLTHYNDIIGGLVTRICHVVGSETPDDS